MTYFYQSLVLILILIPIKSRIDILFCHKAPHPTTGKSTLLDIVQTFDISGYSSKYKLFINIKVV